ncbi:MAG: radical SAM protein [Eggerthellaceae bacterium]|nr:radical SAM protein [Eggerthellaceae bacterium]
MANDLLKQALSEYDDVRKRYIAALEEHGIVFAEEGANDARIQQLRDELRKAGAEFKNAGASIVYGWQSKACVECTGTGGSETFSTTFKCHRDCYFCFNYNVADYDKFVREGCPWEQGLADSLEQFDGLAAIGLTGGEPLLVLDESVEFLERAREAYPDAHLRMYTSGDLLTEEGAARLRDAGLREIRFSVKQDDEPERQERVLQAMQLAKRYIPDVMVEMPIIPGTGGRMRELFDRWAEIGIDGINLLEFCFPFHSWDEFAARGFEIRNPPFDVMYDYGYSGGLPVAGSEELCLELMLYGIEQHAPFGMHYCSLDNKHRSEMRQRNERGARIHPCYRFDRGDFFLKTAKVFGEDRELAKKALISAGCMDYMNLDHEGSTCFPMRFAGKVRDAGADVCTSFNVLQQDGEGAYLQEVGLVLDDMTRTEGTEPF